MFGLRKQVKIHWNYFLALEQDAVRLSRFLEFNEKNFPAYSVEMARIFMTACSEIDVISKAICQQIDANVRVREIPDYAAIILGHSPSIREMIVEIPRYGLQLLPWKGWEKSKPPEWWTHHNHVKHQRDLNFEKANLGNCLNALAGLYVMVVGYYFMKSRDKMESIDKCLDKLKERSLKRRLLYCLQPQPQLFTLHPVLDPTNEVIMEGMADIAMSSSSSD